MAVSTLFVFNDYRIIEVNQPTKNHIPPPNAVKLRNLCYNTICNILKNK